MKIDEQTILKAITPFLDEAEKQRDLKFEIESYGCRERRVSFLREALADFFSQDIEEVVKVEPVWKWLQLFLKEDINYILDDREEFLINQHWKLKESVYEFLQALENSLDLLLRKQQQEIWRRKTVQDAEEQLKEWKDKGVFVALLDKKGQLLTEPYPISINSKVKFKVTIEPDHVFKNRKNIVARFDKAIKHGNTEVTAMVLCKMPEKYAKAEIIRLEE